MAKSAALEAEVVAAPTDTASWPPTYWLQCGQMHGAHEVHGAHGAWAVTAGLVSAWVHEAHGCMRRMGA